MGDMMYYIKRKSNGLEIGSENGIQIVNSSLKKYINELCIKHLSTFDGRRISASKLLGETSNIPIYVNHKIVLYPTKSIRCYDTVYINFNEVLSIKKGKNGSLSLLFNNLSELSLEISYNKIRKQHIRINKILDYISIHY